MSDGTSIEWTDATLFGAPLPRRCRGCGETKPVTEFNVDRTRPDGHGYVCRACGRVSPVDVPNRIERADARHRGQGWCRECRSWHPTGNMSKQGVCREHQRAEDRRRYAEDPEHRHRRLQHAIAHRRGILPLPSIAVDYLTEEFEGRCAYCPAPATAWDHVIPVSKGGDTTPLNIVPACKSCNSSKRDRDVWVWIEATGRQPCDRFYERVLAEGDHG